MNTYSTTEASRSTASEPRERDRPDTTSRDAFTESMRRAEGRVRQRSPQDEEPSPDGAAAAVAELRQAIAAQCVSIDKDEALSVAAFAHSLAQPFAQDVQAPDAQPVNPTLSLQEFTAALDKLTVPATEGGLQHWEFTLAHGSGALAGVQVAAHANSPWRVTLKAHGRERSALEANLDDLRTRLRARHGQVGDVLIDDADA